MTQMCQHESLWLNCNRTKLQDKVVVARFPDCPLTINHKVFVNSPKCPKMSFFNRQQTKIFI